MKNASFSLKKLKLAGIYIHIPFCKSKCNYCDFYSETNNANNIEQYTKALQKELDLRSSYFNTQQIETIYFGGGSPSTLSVEQINNVFNKILSIYKLSDNYEFTFEVNPDDLKIKYLEELRNKTSINRLSIGLQSFDNNDLMLMNRRHNAKQAIMAVKNAQKVGFNNISGDLIYGLPNMTKLKWETNLNIFFELNLQHLSAYHLTYEEGTLYYKWLKQKKITEIPEDNSIEQFDLLIDKAKNNNFIQYEISNFGKENYFSKHNSNYWNREQYLGLGSSAHSYDGQTRQWNIANIKNYINSIFENKIPAQKEILSNRDKLNEYIMTSLRTKEGIDFDYIKNNFDTHHLKTISNLLNKKVKTNLIIKNENNYILSQKGKIISDAIITDLFI